MFFQRVGANKADMADGARKVMMVGQQALSARMADCLAGKRASASSVMAPIDMGPMCQQL